MFLDFKLTNALPAGNYVGNLTGYESTNTDYGAGLKWSYSISAPKQYANKVVTQITAAEATAKNSCGRLIVGMTGAAKGVDLDKLVGRSYHLVLGVKPNGFNSIDSIRPGKPSPELVIEQDDSQRIEELFDRSFGGQEIEDVLASMK